MVVFIQQHQRSPYTILLINHIIFIQFFYWLTHECRLMGSIQMRFATCESLISCVQLESESLNGYQTIWHLPWVVTGLLSVLANFHNPGTPSPFHYLNLERFLVLCALTGLKVCKYFFLYGWNHPHLFEPHPCISILYLYIYFLSCLPSLLRMSCTA